MQYLQESAMVVAKLILPQQFEEMSMQELRVLVLESSTMHTYLRGKTFEVLPYDVAIVLEGFVKQEGKDEFATAPAVLPPAHKESHLTNEGSKQSITAHHGEWFKAAARSRIIIFDISSVHNVSHRTRSSTSILSRSIRVPGHPSYEHGGLLSWPEKQNAVTRYASDPGLYRPAEKAMQLSMSGSMLQVPYFTHTTKGYIHSASVGPSNIPPRLGATPRKSADDSCEGSDSEDEYIMRIDSPSKLFPN
ncbi:hypothetical protein SUGI_0795160 [Cryptomeria japonica]|nr:hypothetical protein SUGI_0795160 [Cryptomeria japonica]